MERTVVQVDVPAADAEVAADALWAAGPTAVSEQDLGGGRVRLVADVAHLDRIDLRWPLQHLADDGDSHLDAWRPWAQPWRAGRSLVVQPPWVEPGDRHPGDVVILVDPGRAFGSGSHVATRLALAALEASVRPGDRVFDVGCGSGVLAVASLLLGASWADAVDVDPVAVAASAGNAERNGVGDRLHVALGSVDVAGDGYDLVVANLGVRALSDLAPALVRRIRPGGRLVLSGLLEGQAAPVVDRFTGCVDLARWSAEGWTAPVLRRGS